MNGLSGGTNSSNPTDTGNTYAGGTTVSQGLLIVNTTMADTGFINVNGGEYRVGDTDTVGAVTLSSGTISRTGAAELSGTSFALTDSGTISAVLSGDGALTKTGAGTATLSGANSYTGATNVNAGTLRISGSGGVNGSSGIVVNGSNAKLLHTSSLAVSPTVTLTQGTVTGSGSIQTVNVGAGTGGIISNNDGVAGATLSIGSLTFNGAATVHAYANGASAPISTTNLTTNAAGFVTVNASSTGWAIGSNNLIGYSGSIGGAGFSQFTLGTVSGLSGRQTAVGLVDTGTAVALEVAGDTVVWSGASNGNWVTDATSSPTSGSSNWATKIGTTGTDFWVTESIELNDTYNVGGGAVAVTQTAINISAADVNPTATVFNNSSVDYQLGSTGGFGIASGSLTKNGTGALTITNANTYAGSTNINGGILQIDNASALGTTGSVIFGGGTLKYGTGITTDLSSRFNTASNQQYKIDTNGNNVNLGTALTSSGGTLTKEGAGTLTINGTNTYSGATEINDGTLAITGSIANSSSITNHASLVFNSGSAQSFSNAISGNGTLTKLGAGNLTLSGTNSYSGNTNLSGGTLIAGSNSALGIGDIVFSGSALGLQLNQGVTLANDITIGANAGVQGAGLIKVANGQSATISGTVTINSAAGAGGHFGGLTNTGSGTLHITGAVHSASVPVVQRSGTVVLSGGGSYTQFQTAQGTTRLEAHNGLSTSASVAIATSAGANFDLAGFNQSLAGITKGANNAIIGNSSTTSDSTLTTTGVSNYAGVIQDALGSGTRNVALTINGGSLTLSGANTYTGATTVVAGTLVVNGNNSAATGDVNVDVGGTLTGIGTIGGETTVLGQLNPGNSPGTLSFTDNLTLAGITNMEITGIGAGQYDILNGDGANTINFGGILAIDNTGFFGNAMLGQTVTLFTNWQTRLGTFSAINGLDLGNGLRWDTSSLYSAGSLTVTAVPEPSSFFLFAVTGIGGIIYRRRSRKQMSTSLSKA